MRDLLRQLLIALVESLPRSWFESAKELKLKVADFVQDVIVELRILRWTIVNEVRSFWVEINFGLASTDVGDRWEPVLSRNSVEKLVESVSPYWINITLCFIITFLMFVMVAPKGTLGVIEFYVFVMTNHANLATHFSPSVRETGFKRSYDERYKALCIMLFIIAPLAKYSLFQIWVFLLVYCVFLIEFSILKKYKIYSHPLMFACVSFFAAGGVFCMLTVWTMPGHDPIYKLTTLATQLGSFIKWLFGGE
jgi:uncharacterized membrane protein YhaH (DUF805 family)